MASQITSLLPQSDGLLPKWLLFIAVVSLGNSIQAYISIRFIQEVYCGSSSSSSAFPGSNKPPKDIPTNTLAPNSPVTPLSARTFGTWTALVSVVRIYAAYRIEDGMMYELALWTFGIAWAHFMSEWFVFRTTSWNRGLAGPVLIATGTGIWMLAQWGAYVK